ncbi:hypothetical protein GWI33_022463 [Rhynchophorus ferrugineus]|uniref:Uncharacterized protein n=1 Tax=Rhynchophorus ferrugineus TaxID=354439 RepID=A0A834HM47_RHYFE|nr:hypothetical protein GWI33_022463 [Rhynchophorus ferrugineus]
MLPFSIPITVAHPSSAAQRTPRGSNRKDEPSVVSLFAVVRKPAAPYPANRDGSWASSRGLDPRRLSAPGVLARSRSVSLRREGPDEDAARGTERSRGPQ